MAFFQVDYKSAVLGKQTRFTAVIPENAQNAPVVYLLHGLSDSCTSWMRRSSVERYAEKQGFAVIMPEGERSFYTDMKHGEAFFTAIAEELPEFVSRMLPVSTEREKNFTAGLSMGGYGALKMALRFPEKFAAAGIMSAVTDIPGKFADQLFGQAMWQDIFGSADEAVRDGNDLFTLAEKTAHAPLQPAVIQFCGTEDFLLEDNRKLNRTLEQLKWPRYIYRETPGTHNWEFWDRHIQDVFEFFSKEI